MGRSRLKGLAANKQGQHSYGMKRRLLLAVNALYAAVFEPSVKRLDLSAMPESLTESPDYLGVAKVTDLPQVLRNLGTRVQVR